MKEDNMETNQEKDGAKGCCSKAKCCGGKTLAAIALLLAGTVGGYLCGRHCPDKGGAKAASTQG